MFPIDLTDYLCRKASDDIDPSLTADVVTSDDSSSDLSDFASSMDET